MENKTEAEAKVIIGTFQPLTGMLDGFTCTKNGVIKANPIKPRKKRKKK